MRHDNFKWTKISLCTLAAVSGSLLFAGCSTPKSSAELEVRTELFDSGLKRGIKTHFEEERKARARNQANATFLRDVFGDPNKKKRRITNCLVIRKLELDPVYGIYGHGGGGGGGGGNGGESC